MIRMMMGRFAVFRVWSALPVLTAGAAWVVPIVAACHGTGEVEAGCLRPLVHHRARQPDPFAQLVIGGSIAGSGRLIVRATKVGRDTQLVRLVEQAQSDKASV
jgi:hypothetical protein